MTQMASFIALGVEVAQTELDVRAAAPDNAGNQTQQVIDYYDAVTACVKTAKCVGTTVWDFDDTYSWVPSTFPGQGYADLFEQPAGPDTPLVKKAAYDGAIEALRGEPVSTP
jgi:endo-1,4-beta-xylanase